MAVQLLIVVPRPRPGCGIEMAEEPTASASKPEVECLGRSPRLLEPRYRLAMLEREPGQSALAL